MFQVHTSTIHYLHIALCTHHLWSSLPSSPYIWPTFFSYSPPTFTPRAPPPPWQYFLYSMYHRLICLFGYVFICLPQLNGPLHKDRDFVLSTAGAQHPCLVRNVCPINICQMSTSNLGLQTWGSLQHGPTHFSFLTVHWSLPQTLFWFPPSTNTPLHTPCLSSHFPLSKECSFGSSHSPRPSS